MDWIRFEPATVQFHGRNPTTSLLHPLLLILRDDSLYNHSFTGVGFDMKIALQFSYLLCLLLLFIAGYDI